MQGEEARRLGVRSGHSICTPARARWLPDFRTDVHPLDAGIRCRKIARSVGKEFPELTVGGYRSFPCISSQYHEPDIKISKMGVFRPIPQTMYPCFRKNRGTSFQFRSVLRPQLFKLMNCKPFFALKRVQFCQMSSKNAHLVICGFLSQNPAR